MRNCFIFTVSITLISIIVQNNGIKLYHIIKHLQLQNHISILSNIIYIYGLQRRLFTSSIQNNFYHSISSCFLKVKEEKRKVII